MNRQTYRTTDDEMLIALTNKGILRKAQKDLEKEPPTIASETDDAIVLAFTGDGCQATLPATGLAKATCSCPAHSGCRHIVMSVLYVRTLPETNTPTAALPSDESASPALPPTPADPAQSPLLALTDKDIKSIGTRKVYNAGTHDMETSSEFLHLTLEGSIVLVRDDRYETTVRWQVDAGVDGMICSCKSALPCQHKVAAVLLFQTTYGRVAVNDAKEGLSQDLAHTRIEVLNGVAALLAEMVASGTNRLSLPSAERLTTLSLSAHAAELPALERRLRALAHHVTWLLNRDVRANSRDLLVAAAQTYALVQAVLATQDAPVPALIGEFRSRYDMVGTLGLVGIGAEQWQRRSGFVGLTVFLWDLRRKQWATWSDSRSTTRLQAGFEPEQRYRDALSDRCMLTPQQMAGSAVQILQAKRNRYGNISLSGASVIGQGEVDPASLDLATVTYDDWESLARYLVSIHRSALTEFHPLRQLVIVKPARWDKAEYDQQRQAALRPIRDGAGHTITLVRPHADSAPFASTSLEKWDPVKMQTWGILGQAYLTQHGIELTPVTFLNTAGTSVNLTLDDWQTNGKKRTRRTAAQLPSVVVPENGEDEDDEDENTVASEVSGYIGSLTATVLRELTALSERGVMAISQGSEDHLREVHGRLQAVGLTTLANALSALLAKLNDLHHQLTPQTLVAGHALLRAAYIVAVAREQILMAQAARIS